MIPLAICLIIVWFLLLSSGAVAVRLLAFASGSKLRDTLPNQEDRVAVGLIIQVTVISVVSLFIAIGSIWALLIMLAVAAIGLPDTVGLFRSRTRHAHNWLVSAVALCWIGLMVFVATSQTNHFDTGLYMRKWSNGTGTLELSPDLRI